MITLMKLQKIITKAMELDQPLKVPLVADVKIGKPGRTVNNEKIILSALLLIALNMINTEVSAATYLDDSSKISEFQPIICI